MNASRVFVPLILRPQYMPLIYVYKQCACKLVTWLSLPLLLWGYWEMINLITGMLLCFSFLISDPCGSWKRRARLPVILRTIAFIIVSLRELLPWWKPTKWKTSVGVPWYRLGLSSSEYESMSKDCGVSSSAVFPSSAQRYSSWCHRSGFIN